MHAPAHKSNIEQNYGNSEHTHSEPCINGHLNTHILHTYIQYICVKRMAHTQFLCKSCKRCVYTHTRHIIVQRVSVCFCQCSQTVP